MNTSAIIDFITLNHGLISLVVKGLRRNNNKKKGLFIPFNELKISFSKKSDLGNLNNIDSNNHSLLLKKESLMAGYYINELLIRLATRSDPNVELYNAYVSAIDDLSKGVSTAKSVRIFEIRLLRSIGYGINFTKEIITGKSINPSLYYKYEPENGLILYSGSLDGNDIFLGKDLICMANLDFNSFSVLRSAKYLLSIALNNQLGGKPLKTTYVLNHLYR